MGRRTFHIVFAIGFLCLTAGCGGGDDKNDPQPPHPRITSVKINGQEAKYYPDQALCLDTPTHAEVTIDNPTDDITSIVVNVDDVPQETPVGPATELFMAVLFPTAPAGTHDANVTVNAPSGNDVYYFVFQGVACPK